MSAPCSLASRGTPQPRTLAPERSKPALEQFGCFTRDILHMFPYQQHLTYLGKPGQQVHRQHGQATPLAGGAGAAPAPVPRAPQGGLGCRLCCLCRAALHFLPRVSSRHKQLKVKKPHGPMGTLLVATC